TIGPVTWLARNPTLRNRTVAGLVLALLGDPRNLTYKRTRHGSHRIDHVVDYVLRQGGRMYSQLDYDPFGYNERQFNSPGIQMPIGRLSRAVEAGYPEYHTSADNPNFVKQESLEDSLQALIEIVEAIEEDSTLKSLAPNCEPQLGRRGLYPLASDISDPKQLQKALIWDLGMADGKTGLVEITSRSKLDLGIHQAAAEILTEHQLLSEQTNLAAGQGSTHGQPSSEAIEKCKRAHAVIPGGAHTYAKGDDQFPVNAPRFFSQGSGCYAIDGDGNRFIEYGIGLRAVGLGHAYPTVLDAVTRQVQLGCNFTRPASIELETAEKLLSILPAADMVKFTKNGSDATTAAIRLARAKTKRNRILLCQEQPFFSVDDWFIGTTAMNAGIPGEASSPIVRFPYGDLDALKKIMEEHAGEFAALMMEAANYDEPEPGYLQGVQELCRQHGTLFILDEMITGFRWNVGGAQAEYGLQPDLSTFGKAIGNGFAVAALAGKREHMELGGLDHAQDRVFLLSYTHGAETHSLAAVQATIDTYLSEPVIETMHRSGEILKTELTSVAKQLGIQQHFYTLGRGCNVIFVTEDADGNRCQGYRTLLLQELIKRGVFAPSLVVSYSHGEAEVEATIEAFRGALQVYALALEEGYEKYLDGRPSKPVFRARN
ncbi:MAG: glutamate-1-semialdehyde 2,1-aminomutase, partial [Planctomycetota bacterium]